MARIRNPFPNKFLLQHCTKCNQPVAPGAGVCTEKLDSGWIGEHNECPKIKVNVTVTSKFGTKANEFPPTEEQQAIIDLFRSGQSLVAEAGAGTGKTSTLRFLAVDAMERNIKCLYTTFTRALVDEVKDTMPPNVTALGVHQIAYKAIVENPQTLFGKRLAASKRIKAREVARMLRTQDMKVAEHDIDRVRIASFVMLTISKFCQTADTRITTAHVPYMEGIDAPRDGKRTYDNNRKLAKKIAPVASRAWEDIIDENGVLPYKPEHYLKMWQLSNPVLDYDCIFFDESQDANPVMSAVIDNQTCQRVFVGDAQQAIFEFTGAVNSIAIQKELGLPVAQLSQSFRFGPAVAEVANEILDRIPSADLRIKGFDKIDSVVGPLADHEVDAILTRTNACGISCLLTAQEQGVKAHLIGGSDEFIKLVKAAQTLQSGKTTQHPELISFGTWAEVVKYSEDEEGADLRLFVKLVTDFGTEAIIHALENQVDESDADLVISTAHKSKGREWGKVKLADDFVKPSKPGEEPKPPTESELRLQYVACTRCKTHLDATALQGGRGVEAIADEPQNDAEEV